MSIEKLFSSILQSDIKGNYKFQKNYLSSMCKIREKTLLDLSEYLKQNNVKGGKTSVNKINKGIIPKSFKTRELISKFLEMEQKDIFINIEKLEESKTKYLADNKRNRRS